MRFLIRFLDVSCPVCVYRCRKDSETAKSDAETDERVTVAETEADDILSETAP